MIVSLDGASWDDEPSTAEEESAVAEARAAIGRGEGIGLHQAKVELD
jgi:hypothetical protein